MLIALYRYALFLIASGQARLWLGQHGCARLCFTCSKQLGADDDKANHELTNNPVSFEVEERARPISTGLTLGLEGRLQGGGGMHHLSVSQWDHILPAVQSDPVQPDPEPQPELGPYTSLTNQEAGLCRNESTTRSRDSPFAEQANALDAIPNAAPYEHLQTVVATTMESSRLKVNLSTTRDEKKVREETFSITFPLEDSGPDSTQSQAMDDNYWSLEVFVASFIMALIVWTFDGEDMGPTEPSPNVYAQSRQVKTTAVFPLGQGFGSACFVFAAVWIFRALYVRTRGKSAAHRERIERGKAAKNELSDRLPRSLKDFGVSFSYQLRQGLVGIYVQTVNVDADDADDMAEMEAGQRVTHILDGDGSIFPFMGAELYGDLLSGRMPPVKECAFPGKEGGMWTPSRSLAKTKEILDDEAHGVVRIKRPFTILVEQRQRQDASMSWMLSLLDPTRFIVQVAVIVGLAVVMWISTGMTRDASNWYGMIAMVACFFIFVCDMYQFTYEYIQLKSKRHAVDGATGGQNVKPSTSDNFLNKLGRWLHGQLTRACSWLLFILGASFAWQTPFKTAALNNELQVQLWGRAAGATWMGFDGPDALLRALGLAMIFLFALRNISGDKLRETWNNMASFNSQQKMDEIQFIAMEFLLIGYVMLVSAATQPMACHKDLDSKVKMSADNSIECDFCQVIILTFLLT